MPWSDGAEDVPKLGTFLGTPITRLHVVSDYDPNDKAEADVQSIQFTLADGRAFTVSGEGGSFVKVRTDTALAKDAESHLTVIEPETPADPAEIGPGERGCTCVGEIGEDPACAVHGKPIV